MEFIEIEFRGDDLTCYNGDKHYYNKELVNELFEEAEKRHRENGRLVVCDHAEECVNNECTFKIPYKHYDLEPIRWRCQTDEETQCEAIAFRGEPTREEEVQEYVVVNVISLDSLNESDLISDKYFRELFSTWHQDWPIDDILDNKADIWCSRHCLLEAGFIEKVVHDPVVRVNDVFKRTIDNYRFMLVSSGSGKVILTGIDNNAVYVPEEIFCIGDKLSKFVGKENIKDFKPCKIKITEVEEG